jgi:hypothetical protein
VGQLPGGSSSSAAALRPARLSAGRMGKVRGLRARVHRAAVRPRGEAAPGPVPPAKEPALAQASGAVGGRVSRGGGGSLPGASWIPAAPEAPSRHVRSFLGPRG